MDVVDLVARQALRARGGDVFAARDLEHRVARHARDEARTRQAERDHRHDEVGRRALASRREPPEIYGEEPHEYQAEPERGHGYAEQGARHAPVVELGVGVCRRQHACQQAHNGGEEHGPESELKRVQEAGPDLAQHGRVGEDRAAQVSL